MSAKNLSARSRLNIRRAGFAIMGVSSLLWIATGFLPALRSGAAILKIGGFTLTAGYPIYVLVIGFLTLLYPALHGFAIGFAEKRGWIK